MSRGSRPRSVGRWVLIVLATCSTAAAARAQVNPPGTVDLPNFTTVAAGAAQAFGQDGGFTDAAGTPGANPGYTLFRYGRADGGAGRLRIAATSVSPAVLAYDTANPASPTVNAPPANFDRTQGYTFTIITPKPGADDSSPLQVSANDTNPTAEFLPLNNPADLGAYNDRLNQILKFDASEFIDPVTGQPIVTSGPNAVGSFAYTFSNFDPGVGTYRDISLTFTPVPEPAAVLATAAVGLALAGMVRRVRHRHRKGLVVPAGRHGG